VEDSQALWATGRSVVLSGKPTLLAVLDRILTLARSSVGLTRLGSVRLRDGRVALAGWLADAKFG